MATKKGIHVRVNAKTVLCAMVNKGYDRADLATTAGTTGFTVDRILSGGFVRLSTVKKIADALNVTPDTLLDFSNENA